MEYIIDGYNVIKYSEMFSCRRLEFSRNKLIDFILKYKPHGNNLITVVFDCKSDNPYEFDGYTATSVKGIKTIFSEGRKSADDVIVEYVENSKKPYNIVVVSNDKGIHRRIGGTGAKKMEVADFIYARAKKQTQTNNTIQPQQKNDYSKISKELSDLWISKEHEQKKEKTNKKPDNFDITSELSDLWIKRKK